MCKISRVFSMVTKLYGFSEKICHVINSSHSWHTVPFYNYNATRSNEKT